MLQHHADSIKNMTDHYAADSSVVALFLVGSVATQTCRPDSDVDAVCVISDEAFRIKKDAGKTMETVHGKCTYEGGYFDTHFVTRKHMEDLLEKGSEPMRNLFTNAQMLFCHEEGLPELAAKIAVFPESELEPKQRRYYCTLKQFYTYFWNICKPTGFHRNHVANGMVFSLYRLVLLENRMLFPSMRKVEEVVRQAPNKPDDLFEKCHAFMHNLDDASALEMVTMYENWTKYDYPKEHAIVMNNFSDPNEWN